MVLPPIGYTWCVRDDHKGDVCVVSRPTEALLFYAYHRALGDVYIIHPGSGKRVNFTPSEIEDWCTTEQWDDFAEHENMCIVFVWGTRTSYHLVHNDKPPACCSETTHEWSQTEIVSRKNIGLFVWGVFPLSELPPPRRAHHDLPAQRQRMALDDQGRYACEGVFLR